MTATCWTVFSPWCWDWMAWADRECLRITRSGKHGWIVAPRVPQGLKPRKKVLFTAGLKACFTLAMQTVWLIEAISRRDHSPLKPPGRNFRTWMRASIRPLSSALRRRKKSCRRRRLRRKIRVSPAMQRACCKRMRNWKRRRRKWTSYTRGGRSWKAKSAKNLYRGYTRMSTDLRNQKLLPLITLINTYQGRLLGLLALLGLLRRLELMAKS